jgi:asparagine synthase (glutamine-hydrolysing)
MSDYVALLAPPEGAPPWVAAHVAAPPAGWTARSVGRVHVFQREDRSDPLRPVFGGVALGELFPRPGAAPPERGLHLLRPQAAARRLTAEAFGAFVVIGRDPETGAAVVYRDPSGAMDAVVWHRDGVLVAASAAPDWLGPLLPPDLALDWDHVAALAGRPVLQSAGVALGGLAGLAPGELWADGRREQVWRPADFAARRREPARADPQALVGLVDHVVAAEAEGPCLLELSGGLDSAIVGASLAAAGRAVQAVNYLGVGREADERLFAQAAADRFGFALEIVDKPTAPLDLLALGRVSGGFRPARNGFDHAHDADIAARLQATGARTLVTGQGGDHVFFQAPTPLIAGDGLGDGLTLELAAALARWQGVSVYKLVRQGLAAKWRRPTPAALEPHLTPKARAQARAAHEHPWLVGLDALPPAKRLQAESLAHALNVRGPSLRGAAARLRHPLISAPVMEHALGIAVINLVQGGRDRGLARAAFADRLPQVIAARQSKGRLTGHYGRSLAASLPALRRFLLEGELAAAGVVDGTSLGEALTEQSFLWRGRFGQVINLLMLELWVRAWRTRLGRPAS